MLLGVAVALIAALALPSLAAAQGEGKRDPAVHGHDRLPSHGRHQQRSPVRPERRWRRLGYTVEWEDCTNNGGAANELQQRRQEPAHLHGHEPRALRRDRVPEHVVRAGGNRPARCWDDAAEERDHQVHAERRRHHGHPQRDGHRRRRIRVGLVGRQQPELHGRHHHGRPRGDEPERNVATGAGRRPNHLSTKDLPDHVRRWGTSTTTSAQRPRRPPRARDARRAHLQPGRQRQGPGSPDHLVQALRRRRTSTTARRRRKDYTDGRTWVTGMGHFGLRYTEHGGDNPLVNMIVGGIRWVAGEGKKTDCSGTVWSSYRRTVLVADANQPIGIDVAKDGKVYWSEAGLLGTAANQYNSQGAIMMHDQKGAAGQQDHGRHDPDARRSRQLRGRRPRLHAAAGLRPRRTRTSVTCSRTTRRAPAPVTTGRSWPRRPRRPSATTRSAAGRSPPTASRWSRTPSA